MSKRVYVVWIGLVLMLFGSILYLGMDEKSVNEEFTRMENTLEEAASIYVKRNNLGIVTEDELKIDINSLFDEKYVDKISVNNNKCNGFIIVVKKNGINTYNANITCGSYHSINN